MTPDLAAQLAALERQLATVAPEETPGLVGGVLSNKCTQKRRNDMGRKDEELEHGDHNPQTKEKEKGMKLTIT